MTLSADLCGVTALVSGASGGLGQHFSRTLAGAGAQVVLAARRLGELEILAETIEAEGGEATAVECDVTDADSIDAAFDAAEIAFGTVNLLVNNAGVAITRKAMDLTEAEWDRVVDTNLKGAFMMAQAAARRMLEAGRGGSIINITSIIAHRVAGAVAPYLAAKAALAHLTAGLAQEWARHEIRVNAIAPGYIETDINRDFFRTDAGAAVIRRIPMRRLGQMEDLDGALLLLASEASRFMTGSTIVVDGGHCHTTI